MWKAVQTIGIFGEEDDEIDIQEKSFEDGTNSVLKKLKGADRTVKKSESDTGNTLRRKALTKTVKKQITNHITELNPTNVSLVSLSKAKRVLLRRESDLLKFCKNLTPSTADFLVKHLQEMFEVLYKECSTIKDCYLQFQLKWHKHCILLVVEKNLELSLMGLYPKIP